MPTLSNRVVIFIFCLGIVWRLKSYFFSLEMCLYLSLQCICDVCITATALIMIMNTHILIQKLKTVANIIGGENALILLFSLGQIQAKILV